MTSFIQVENVTPLPTLKQIQNYVSRIASRGPAFTQQQLIKYCEENLLRESDAVEKVGVFNYEVDTDADRFFVMWTNKKLLDRQLNSSLLQVLILKFIQIHVFFKG